VLRIVFTLLLWLLCVPIHGAELSEALSEFAHLQKLYQTYPLYRDQLSQYAIRQGFTRPVENLATVVHENIHIDSAAHDGYFVDGIYYEPYLRREAWPHLTNSQVGAALLSGEKGLISNVYVRNAPNNHLGNVVDEINAYTHVLPMVCRFEPESKGKQITNLTGFLNLAEGYLRTMRTNLPREYARLSGNREARGAFTLIVQRAWTALRDCGVSDAAMSVQEARYFIAISAQRQE